MCLSVLVTLVFFVLVPVLVLVLVLRSPCRQHRAASWQRQGAGQQRLAVAY